MFFLRMHVELRSEKFLTWEIIKLQYRLLVSWVGEEQQIKYILSNISEDFVSHLYASTGRKKGPKRTGLVKKSGCLSKWVLCNTFSNALFSVIFIILTVCVSSFGWEDSHCSKSHSISFFSFWHLFYIFIPFEVTIFHIPTRSNPSPT